MYRCAHLETDWILLMFRHANMCFRIKASIHIVFSYDISVTVVIMIDASPEIFTWHQASVLLLQAMISFHPGIPNVTQGIVYFYSAKTDHRIGPFQTELTQF